MGGRVFEYLAVTLVVVLACLWLSLTAVEAITGAFNNAAATLEEAGQ